MTGKKIIEIAKKYLGENGRRFCRDYGIPFGSHYCCAFVWDIFRISKASKLFYGGKKTAYVPTAQVWLKAHCKHVKMADARPGDIVIFTWHGGGYNRGVGTRDHIGFIRKKGTSQTAYTIEGNTGGSGPTTSKVMKRTRSVKYIFAIYRPNYKTEKKAEPAKTTAKKNKKKQGFDISYAQRNITLNGFKKAKKAGYEFVVIRLGTRLNGKLYTDDEFESKYKLARKAGLKVGVYFYSKASTKAAAKIEAEYVLKKLKGRALDYPVFIDYEDKVQKHVTKANAKKLIEEFCRVIEKAGYDAGVYASYSWLTSKIAPISDKYYVWLAQYPKATYKGRYEMHQYSSTTKVPGIGAEVDVDVSTIPYGKYPVKKK